MHQFLHLLIFYLKEYICQTVKYEPDKISEMVWAYITSLTD